jgi:hypothetical protein
VRNKVDHRSPELTHKVHLVRLFIAALKLLIES